MKNQHHHQALAKKGWTKINTSTLSATAIASASLASMSTGILIDIEQSPQYFTQSNLQQRIFSVFLAKMQKVIFYSREHHWNHPFLFQEKGGAWSALIPEERIECMHVQEEVEGQHVNSHKSFPSLLILVICELSDAYKFLSGSVRVLVHKYVDRRARRSQNEYISEKKKYTLW